MYQSNSCIKRFFFSFPLDFFTYRLDFSVCLSLQFSAVFHFGFHPVLEFLFLVLFWVQWMLVTVNKAEFSLQKTLITFNKIPAMWGTLCIRLIPHHEKRHARLCALLLQLLLFPPEHMKCHVFTHETSN